MRDNYVLWVAWWGVLFFCISYLYGEASTLNCTSKKFENNKWTNWGMYSLFYLAHEFYFPRMMRTVAMYICFCWQCCVAAILYGHLYSQMPDAWTIIVFALIAWACSLPLQWVFGIFSQTYNARCNSILT